MPLEDYLLPNEDILCKAHGKGDVAFVATTWRVVRFRERFSGRLELSDLLYSAITSTTLERNARPRMVIVLLAFGIIFTVVSIAGLLGDTGGFGWWWTIGIVLSASELALTLSGWITGFFHSGTYYQLQGQGVPQERFEALKWRLETFDVDELKDFMAIVTKNISPPVPAP